MELADLLSSNLQSVPDVPQVIMDGRLVLPVQKKRTKEITDIATWSEAFAIYSLVLGFHFPNRWYDLTAYNLTILKLYKKFTGPSWLSYDRAFREFAAATGLTVWSSVNLELYNFHTAGVAARSVSGNKAFKLVSQRVG